MISGTWIYCPPLVDVSRGTVVAFELKAGQRALRLHCLVIMSEMLAVGPPDSLGVSNKAHVGTRGMMSAECFGTLRDPKEPCTGSPSGSSEGRVVRPGPSFLM